MLSIQSLMNETPYHNEPSFEADDGSGDVQRYNEKISHESVRVAVCEVMEDTVENRAVSSNGARRRRWPSFAQPPSCPRLPGCPAVPPHVASRTRQPQPRFGVPIAGRHVSRVCHHPEAALLHVLPGASSPRLLRTALPNPPCVSAARFRGLASSAPDRHPIPPLPALADRGIFLGSTRNRQVAIEKKEQRDGTAFKMMPRVLIQRSAPALRPLPLELRRLTCIPPDGVQACTATTSGPSCRPASTRSTRS